MKGAAQTQVGKGEVGGPLLLLQQRVEDRQGVFQVLQQAYLDVAVALGILDHHHVQLSLPMELLQQYTEYIHTMTCMQFRQRKEKKKWHAQAMVPMGGTGYNS